MVAVGAWPLRQISEKAGAAEALNPKCPPGMDFGAFNGRDRDERDKGMKWVWHPVLRLDIYIYIYIYIQMYI